MHAWSLSTLLHPTYPLACTHTHSHSVTEPIEVMFGQPSYTFGENAGTGTITVVTNRPTTEEFSFTLTARMLS